jgi:FKBP-type peptidyl-prolyl cis-trans isomerase
LFKLGTGSVIPGLDDMVASMTVGQKVQAIIPPTLAYGDKGEININTLLAFAID